MEFFRSVTAVVTFTSNFFFWFQTGYFDRAAVEKPLLHTWSLAVEEQFYLALPVLLWGLLRLARNRRTALPVALGAMALASFALSIWLMKTDRSANAFFMSPPRAWEFLIGGILAVEGFPVLRGALAQQIARGIALVLMAIPIFSLRQGPGFPGINALLPCIGAAVFIWSGIGVPTQKRSWYSHHNIVRFFGQISYSLYLWHWPLFTFARFSKTSLVLDPFDKVALYALTVAISYLSWRYVEQPFRRRSLAPTRSAAFRIAGLATAALLVASAGIIVISQTPSGADLDAKVLDFYNTHDPRYRDRGCFTLGGERFGDACLALVREKTNLLLWGDSLAAHYYDGLGKMADAQAVNILQATQAACMPTLNAAAARQCVMPQLCRANGSILPRAQARPRHSLRGLAGIRPSAEIRRHDRRSQTDDFAAQRPWHFRGVARPAVQFRTRLPSMLMRAQLRHIDPRPEHFVLPRYFPARPNDEIGVPGA